MPGKNHRVNPLELRRLLLVAESDLNRARLGEEMALFSQRLRPLAGRVRSFGSLASTAGLVATGLAALKGIGSARSAVKSSWPGKILKGAGLALTLWLAHRRRSPHQPAKTEKS